MPSDNLPHKLLLPELRPLAFQSAHRQPYRVLAEKTSASEVCPKCGTLSSSIYDRRWVTLKDEPLLRRTTLLCIRKRRFCCKPCGKPFTEPVAGIRKRARTTERYRRAVVWGCETFADLKKVRRHFKCSGGYVYDNLYPLLQRRQRERTYPWPKAIGIDEHSFKRGKAGFMRFATIVVDHKGKRLIDVVDGKTGVECRAALAHIPGRRNITRVTLDMSDSYKSFAREFFPNAKLIADKFHVLRLLQPALNRRRRELVGPKRTPRLRRLLLKDGRKLTLADRHWLRRWLDDAPLIQEIYLYKEALHRLYRTKGYNRACRAFTALTDALAKSQIPELKTLRKTLMRWRNEILEYFRNRLTNARTEGFNNVAKLVKKRAYGYRSFKTYRLRLLQACA